MRSALSMLSVQKRCRCRAAVDGDGGPRKTGIFDRYQRSEKALVVGLMEMYPESVSTRKVTEVELPRLCGTGFSKSTVSRLAGELDGDLTAWRDRRLDDVAYPYLVIDARYEHVRIGGQVVTQGVLIAQGVREDGHRELLAVDVADTESEATYDELFRRLKEHGLHGVRLVTSDDHRGLVAAIERQSRARRGNAATCTSFGMQVGRSPGSTGRPSRTI